MSFYYKKAEGVAVAALFVLSLLTGSGAFAQAKPTSSAPAQTCQITGGSPDTTCAGAGNPINVTNGNKYQREIDLAPLPGVLGLELIRHYNSTYSVDGHLNGIMGRGWKLSYETELLVQGHTIQVLQADGGRIIFARSPLDRNLASSSDLAQGQIKIGATTRGDEYVWRLPNGRELSFDAQGKLVQIRVPTGEFVSLVRDRRGSLVKVTDPQGRSLNLTYLDAKDRSNDPAHPRFSGVQHIDTPVGRFGYSYGSAVPKGSKATPMDVVANLVQVTIPTQYDANTPAHPLTSRGTTVSTLSRQYLYEDARYPTLLTGIVVNGSLGEGKPVNQRISTYVYDERGWAVRSEHGTAVDLLEMERATLLPSGKPGRVVLVHSKSKAYPQGQPLEVISAQIAGNYRIIEARGVACPKNVNCPQGNVRWDYDQQGRVTQVTTFAPPTVNAKGKGWQVAALDKPVGADKYEYDGRGREVRHLALSYGGQRWVTGKPPQPQVRVLEEREYADDSDRPSVIRTPSVVPGQWREVQTSYNKAGQVTRVTQLGHSPAIASLVAQRLERTTTYRYTTINGRSVLAAIDGPLPGPSDTSAYEWDARGDFVRQVSYPHDFKHRFKRDADSGRLIEDTPPDGVPISHAYLPTGEDTRWQRGPAIVNVSYDAAQRPTRIEQPDGEVQIMAYDNASGAAGMASNAGWGKWLVPPALPLQAQAQAMEPQAELEAVPSPWAGQQVVMDDFSRLIGMHTDTTGWEVRRYDNQDRLLERHLADGTTWHWQRDALGRIVRHDVSRTGAATMITTLTYQGSRLVSIQHPNESERYAYDALGRVTTRTVARMTPHGSLSYSERYEHDGADRLTALYLPEGGTLRYTWGVGRQLREIDHDNGWASAVLGQRISAWLGWGHQTIIAPLAESATSKTVAGASVPERGYRWGNGVELRWQLDPRGRLAGLRYLAAQKTGAWHDHLVAWLPSAQAATSPAEPVAKATQVATTGRTKVLDLAYDYDTLGRMSQRHEDGASTGYAYDRAGRLLASQSAATPTQVEYYAYDRQGSMLGSAVQGSTVDWRKTKTQRNASGVPVSVTAPDYQRGLQYSADNRLIAVQQGGAELARYGHNTHGQRISKTLANGLATDYLWLQGQLVGETEPTKAVKSASGDAVASEPKLSRRYVYAHGVPVAVIDYAQGAHLQAEPEADQASGVWHQTTHWVQTTWRAITSEAPRLSYLHANEIGTPVAATNAKGQVIWRASYSAYGLIKAVSQPGPSTQAGHVPQPGINGFELNLRLPGQYFDAETGWHDNGMRTYDPQRGEYLEPDPLGPLPNIKAAWVAWAQGRPVHPLTQPFAYANHNPLIYADPSGLILFAFDGTGNTNDMDWLKQNGSSLSNVVNFKEFYRSDSGAARYISGVGTTDKSDPARPINPSDYKPWYVPLSGASADSGFNYTGPARINRMVEYFNTEADNAADDSMAMEVDIVGFSRGASQARDFANRIVANTKDGWYRYQVTNAEGGQTTKCQKVDFRFMGLFDTVLSTNESGYSYKLAIPEQFAYVAQAVALNEYRGDTLHPFGSIGAFPLESIMPGMMSPVPIAGQTRIERGFIGAHADIGGGFAENESQLAKVALAWMVDQAVKAGVEMTRPEPTIMANPVLHDKSDSIMTGVPKAKAEDRVVRYSGGTSTTQRDMPVSAGMSYSDTQSPGLIDYLPKDDPKRFVSAQDGQNFVTGTVNMQKYLDWLNANGYNINLTVQ